jgi:hexokinase
VAGFELTGAVGEDPVRLLAEAFRRRKLPVQVTVLINDAPGVLAAGRYMNPTTMIGVILGTGEHRPTVDEFDAVGGQVMCP